VFDPLLPAPLVDAEARHTFSAMVQRFDREGHAIWQQFHQQALSSLPAARLSTH